MTTPRQATARLGELHVDYCPVLDQLKAATPDNVDTIVAEEQRLAEQIWKLGYIAFGSALGATLHMLKHDYDEVEEIHDVDWLNDAHRLALIGCCVRSRRLGNYLKESRAEQAPDKMLRAGMLYEKLVADRGKPQKHGDKARLYREIAEEIRCRENTVK